MEGDFSFHGVFLPPGFLSLGNGRVDRREDSTFLSVRSMAPPPQLPDGIIEDIFLRVPPDDPARLLRVALACKRWARLVADRGFRRRYRERHGRAPHILGFLANLIDNAGVTRFVPTGAFRPARADRNGYRVHDSRHGRVLLNWIGKLPQRQDAAALAVWDPTTDEQWPLPLLQRCQQVLHWNAAVLCGAAGSTCDHVDCHPRTFSVVFVGIDAEEMFAHVYSSDHGVWSEGTSAELPDEPLHEGLSSALARNALYFMFLEGTRILKYDLATGSMSVIALPHRPDGRHMVLITMEDGGLGFAEVDFFGRSLRLWAMETGPAGGWAQRTVIQLRTHLAPCALRCSPDMVAFADIAGVIFLNTTDGLYTFDLKTRKGMRVMSNRFYDIVPYVSLYTPVLRAALATSGEGSSAGASTSA